MTTPNNDTSTGLGRFGHHPDPAIDFCIEVESLESIVADKKLGLRTDEDWPRERIAKAMQFRVGADENCVTAKQALRKLEAAMTDTSTPGLMPVTQADRDAAADFRMAYSGNDGMAVAMYRDGRRDGSVCVQAFARHRIRTEGGKQSSHTAGVEPTTEEVIELINVVVDLAEAEAIDKAYPEVLERLTEYGQRMLSATQSSPVSEIIPQTSDTDLPEAINATQDDRSDVVAKLLEALEKANTALALPYNHDEMSERVAIYSSAIEAVRDAIAQHKGQSK